MVEDRITDGKRIAQLLASELTGLETGPLADVAIVDADPDVTPTPAGVQAYDVEYRGTVVGSVVVYPESAAVNVETSTAQPVTSETPLPAESTADGIIFRVDSGVAVKRAVDAIRRTLDRLD